MYLKKTKEPMPKRVRRQKTRFEMTPEWQQLKADIDKGLKPSEWAGVILSDSDKEKYGIGLRLVPVRFIKKYLAANNLTYGVRSFHKDGGDFFIVYCPSLKAKRKAA